MFSSRSVSCEASRLPLSRFFQSLQMLRISSILRRDDQRSQPGSYQGGQRSMSTDDLLARTWQARRNAGQPIHFSATSARGLLPVMTPLPSVAWVTLTVHSTFPDQCWLEVRACLCTLFSPQFALRASRSKRNMTQACEALVSLWARYFRSLLASGREHPSTLTPRIRSARQLNCLRDYRSGTLPASRQPRMVHCRSGIDCAAVK